MKKPKKSVRRKAAKESQKAKRISGGGSQSLPEERRAALDSMAERLQLEWKKTAVAPADGVVKSSEALSKIVEPYLGDASDLQGYEKLLMLGMIAWNFSHLAPKEQEKEKARLFKIMSAEAGVESAIAAVKIIDHGIARKMAFFPDDKREMVDLEVSERKDEFVFRVAAIMPESPES